MRQNVRQEPHLRLFTIAAIVCFLATPAVQSMLAQPAPRVASALTGAELRDLEAVRRKVWVDWFSGDTASLRRVLAPELVAMSSGSTNWQSLAETIASSAKFKAEGGKFVSVEFESTVTHRFGDAVVMFSRYSIATEKAGRLSSEKGRVTEVFVRSGGRWVHTSWQLDNDG